MTKPDLLDHIYSRLFDTYGPQSWWPADTPFEVMVGAVLTQNTSWANVEKAISRLRRACDLTPGGILSVPEETLREAVRPSGYFNQKAEKLRALCRYLSERHGGRLSGMDGAATEELRAELLGLHGIGPETADSILLYALGRPVFVVDAYTVRIFSRLGLCTEAAKYDEVQRLFMDNLEPDTRLFNEYHALIVRHCKHACRRTDPDCNGCPLACLCRHNSGFQNPHSKRSS